MNRLILIIFVFISVRTFPQVPNNRNSQLSKEEFNDLLQYKYLFVPVDLKNDTVVIVQYSPEQFSAMILEARKLSFSKNGTDTGALTNDSTYLNRKWLQKLSTKNPEDLRKNMKKKGIESIIVREQDLHEHEKFSQKYWLKSTFISTQKSIDDLGWVLTYTYFFHDPRTGKDYETLLSTNHYLLEMIP